MALFRLFAMGVDGVRQNLCGRDSTFSRSTQYVFPPHHVTLWRKKTAHPIKKCRVCPLLGPAPQCPPSPTAKPSERGHCRYIVFCNYFVNILAWNLMERLILFCEVLLAMRLPSACTSMSLRPEDICVDSGIRILVPPQFNFQVLFCAVCRKLSKYLLTCQGKYDSVLLLSRRFLQYSQEIDGAI